MAFRKINIELIKERIKKQSLKGLKRTFTGIWLPKEIWLTEEIGIMEKIVWAEIASLDNEETGGCFAQNDYFADLLGVGERQVQRIISNLKKYNYIYEGKFNGRKRYLHSSIKTVKLVGVR
jgi:hypothetical protein